MARPKEDLSSLPDNWQKEVLELYKEGASDVEVKALICSYRGSISNDLWERWMNEEPVFSETIKKGKLLSNAWWEKHGRSELQNKEFNSALWYMNMKNRFKWTDRQEASVTVTENRIFESIDLDVEENNSPE